MKNLTVRHILFANFWKIMLNSPLGCHSFPRLDSNGLLKIAMGTTLFSNIHSTPSSRGKKLFVKNKNKITKYDSQSIFASSPKILGLKYFRLPATPAVLCGCSPFSP